MENWNFDFLKQLKRRKEWVCNAVSQHIGAEWRM